MDFPVLLNMETPQVYAYSIYSVISEKFEAIVSLGIVNSRYKISMTFISLLLTMNWIQKNSKKQSLKPLNIEAQNLTILLLLRKNLRKMNSITGDGILL